ncbi:MAG: hypothetical protein ACI9WS_002299, partial [Paraglaciecola psychrophila]
ALLLADSPSNSAAVISFSWRIGVVLYSNVCSRDASSTH